MTDHPTFKAFDRTVADAFNARDRLREQVQRGEPRDIADLRSYWGFTVGDDEVEPESFAAVVRRIRRRLTPPQHRKPR